MTRLVSVALAGLLAASILFASPAVKAEPAPVAMPVVSMSISDGNGGRDKLTMFGMLQPKRERHVTAVKARSKAIAAALKGRLRNIKSSQLIPPTGNTEWLEKELWALAEHMLKPIELDGAFFSELSIE